MFNITSFNRAPFNRPYAIETFFTVTFGSATEVASRMSVDFPVAVVFDSATVIQTQMIREMPFAAEIDTATELLAQLVRERLLGATIGTSTEIIVNVSYSHVDELKFLGDFKPGDKLVIDTRKMTVTLNGQNAIHLFDGDFFELALGTNKLTYSDGESARSILTRITHRDKFLY
ncbi:phage tail family protein [Paenibacillus alvei]|uniref:Phage tail family protein n=1 Tax=Paenibacillus alvei TaxID=44250 RepID=A0ABT4EK23_PAEAL|nr:phage tail domain-containing protein [Paenibacillus alvei]MCY9532988.1 phage tail family protein [Paenibacillus alvei]